MGNMSKNKQNTLMTHEACESKLRSVVRSSMHPYPGNWVAIGYAVVYYAWAARIFSAGIKCRHCSLSALVQSSLKLQLSKADYFGYPGQLEVLF